MADKKKKEKELRQMNRSELVQVIYELRMQNEEMQTALDDRVICMEKAGSIAEASLEVNKVFAAAQKAADDYVESVLDAFSDQEGAALQNQVDEILATARRRGDEEAARIVAQAKEQAKKDMNPTCAKILKQAEEEAGAMRAQAEQEATEAHAQAEEELSQAHKEAGKLVADAKKEVDDLREQFLAEVTDIMQKHPEIRRYRKTDQK